MLWVISWLFQATDNLSLIYCIACESDSHWFISKGLALTPMRLSIMKGNALFAY